MVVRETLIVVVAGVSIGVPAALVGSRVIANGLFGIAPADPLFWPPLSQPGKRHAAVRS